MLQGARPERRCAEPPPLPGHAPRRRRSARSSPSGGARPRGAAPPLSRAPSAGPSAATARRHRVRRRPRQISARAPEERTRRAARPRDAPYRTCRRNQSFAIFRGREFEAGCAEFEHELRGSLLARGLAHGEPVESHTVERMFLSERREILRYQPPIDCSSLQRKATVARTENDGAQPETVNLPAAKRLQARRETGCGRGRVSVHQIERVLPGGDVGDQFERLRLKFHDTVARAQRRTDAVALARLFRRLSLDEGNRALDAPGPPRAERVKTAETHAEEQQTAADGTCRENPLLCTEDRLIEIDLLFHGGAAHSERCSSRRAAPTASRQLGSEADSIDVSHRSNEARSRSSTSKPVSRPRSAASKPARF